MGAALLAGVCASQLAMPASQPASQPCDLWCSLGPGGLSLGPLGSSCAVLFAAHPLFCFPQLTSGVGLKHTDFQLEGEQGIGLDSRGVAVARLQSCAVQT